MRHGGYCIDNIAFAYNIARWQRLLVFNRDPLQWQLTIRRALIAVCTLFVGVALTFMIIQATNNLNPNLQITFYLIQGLGLRGLLMAGYFVVIFKVKSFTNKQLENLFLTDEQRASLRNRVR